MKSNLKFVLVTMIVVSLFFNLGTVYAAGESSIFGDIASNLIGGVTKEIGGALTGVIGGITGNPLVTGIVGAGISGYLTYNQLSDLNVSSTMQVDRVNLS